MASKQNNKRRASSYDAYSDLARELRAGRVRPLYLLYGEEGFLLADLISRIKAALLPAEAADLDLSVYDADNRPSALDWVRIEQELSTPPFLAAKRLLIIKNSGLFRSSGGLAREQEEALLRCLEGREEACLVFREEQVDKRVKKCYALVEKRGLCAEIARLDEPQLLDWIASALQRRGLRVTREAAAMLIARCESDMLALSNELKKLRLFAEASGLSSIGREEVEALGRPDLSGSIFDLTDALAAGDTARALGIYRLLRLNREADMRILFMLARHVRQLACARSAGDEEVLRGCLKLQPFVARRLLRQSRAFDALRLAHMYALCCRQDSRIKWGKINEGIALESLIVSLSTALR